MNSGQMGGIHLVSTKTMIFQVLCQLLASTLFWQLFILIFRIQADFALDWKTLLQVSGFGWWNACLLLYSRRYAAGLSHHQTSRKCKVGTFDLEKCPGKGSLLFKSEFYSVSLGSWRHLLACTLFTFPFASWVSSQESRNPQKGFPILVLCSLRLARCKSLQP